MVIGVINQLSDLAHWGTTKSKHQKNATSVVPQPGRVGRGILQRNNLELPALAFPIRQGRLQSAMEIMGEIIDFSWDSHDIWMNQIAEYSHD